MKPCATKYCNNERHVTKSGKVLTTCYPCERVRKRKYYDAQTRYKSQVAWDKAQRLALIEQRHKLAIARRME